MSNHRLSARVRVAILIVPLAASLACASKGGNSDRRPAAPPPNPGDPQVLESRDGKTIENLFVGRFPGVQVTPIDGGGLQFRIRGGNAGFMSGDEPLIVVDETPLPDGSKGIVYINPNDIERIQVLKNPADIAVYGLRGSSGVIKITTKRPAR